MGPETVPAAGQGDGGLVKTETKTRKRIVRRDQYFDITQGQVRLVKTTKPESRKQSRNALLVVRRLINTKGIHTHTEVDVKSGLLAEVMLEINIGVEGISLRGNPPVTPLDTFFYNKSAFQERLDAAKKAEPLDSDLVADLTDVITFVNEEYASTTLNLDPLLAVGEVTWDLLWAIFPPNILVYRDHPLIEQAQVLKLRTIKSVERMNKSKHWVLECHIVTHDGVKFGLAYEPFSMKIDEFAGARKIKDLRIFPLKYHDAAAQIRTDAIRTGRRFAALTHACVMETSGAAMFEKRDVSNSPHGYKFNSYGRAIIDPAGFRMSNPNITFLPEVHMRLSPETLSEDELVISSPVALGFCLGNKKWGGFAMSRLLNIKWNDRAFQQLVMGGPKRRLLHSMVKQHSSQDESFDDIISGKGKGIVCLFSGPPGSGKTLSAEAVAEVTKRCLYSVSAGDLGVEPEDVGRRLGKILELSHQWNAVLLIDEADVFLEQRQPKDVRRNALVSIFLQQLEYYQGILILTTNRLAQIDSAFESRVHLSILYHELDEAARKHIWTIFLIRLREAHPGTKPDVVSEDDLSRLAKFRMNGRQIKNMFNCSRIFAKDLGQPLSMDHITQVLAVNQWGTASDLE